MRYYYRHGSLPNATDPVDFDAPPNWDGTPVSEMALTYAGTIRVLMTFESDSGENYMGTLFHTPDIESIPGVLYTFSCTSPDVPDVNEYFDYCEYDPGDSDDDDGAKGSTWERFKKGG